MRRPTDRGAPVAAVTQTLSAGEGAAGVFRWIFAFAWLLLAGALAALLVMQERPLRATPAGREPAGD